MVFVCFFTGWLLLSRILMRLPEWQRNEPDARKDILRCTHVILLRCMFLVLLNCELEEEDCVESIWSADEGHHPSQFVSQSVGGVSSVRDVVCGAFASMLVWWRRKWLMLSSGAVERRIRRSINAWQLRLYWWSLWRRRGAESEAVIRSDHFCV